MAAFSKPKKVNQHPWRPDFRDASTLPDTKVIRTGFLLNFIAVVAALAAASVYGVREYSLQALSSSADSLREQVEAASSRNREILEQNRRFRSSSDVVGEAVRFNWQPIPYSGYVVDLSRVLQEGVMLSFIEVSTLARVEGNDRQVLLQSRLTGRILDSVRGTPSQALQALEVSLRNLDCFGEREVRVETSQFGRNNQFGYFDFSLMVEVKLEEAPKL